MGAQAWNETGHDVSPGKDLRVLEFISSDLMSLGQCLHLQTDKIVSKLGMLAHICSSSNGRRTACKSKASLGYRERPHLNKTSKQKANRKENVKAMALQGCEEGKLTMHMQSSA